MARIWADGRRQGRVTPKYSQYFVYFDVLRAYFCVENLHDSNHCTFQSEKPRSLQIFNIENSITRVMSNFKWYLQEPMFEIDTLENLMFIRLLTIHKHANRLTIINIVYLSLSLPAPCILNVIFTVQMDFLDSSHDKIRWFIISYL